MENKRGLLIWTVGVLVVILIYGSVYFATLLKPYLPESEREPWEIVTSSDGDWRLLAPGAILDYRMDSLEAQKYYHKTHPEFMGDSTVNFKYITYAKVEFYTSGMVIARNIITNKDTMPSYFGNWRIEDKHLVFDNPLFLCFPEKNMLRGFK